MDISTVLNNLFKMANKKYVDKEYQQSSLIYKKIINKISDKDKVSNWVLYNNYLVSLLYCQKESEFANYLSEIIKLKSKNRKYMTCIWKICDLLATEIKKENFKEYFPIFSKEPLIYNNLLGHDFFPKCMYDKILNGITNEVDYHLLLAKRNINLTDRYRLTNDNQISKNIWNELLKVESIVEKYSQTKSKTFDFNSVFRRPLLYSLSYIHTNNKPFLVKLSEIYRKFNTNLNYVCKRCQNGTIVKRKRIKIGFISMPFLSMLSSVFRDRSNMIKFLPSSMFEKVLIVQKKYNFDTKQKEILNIIDGLHKSVDHILELPIILEEPKKFIQSIENLNLDILVYCDIGMSAESVILAHTRLAPVQINTWGHSVTSGISTIDHYFSSSLYELPDAQKHYSEKLVPMDSMCTSYFQIQYRKEEFEMRKKYNLPDDKYILFCMQNSFKINIGFIELLKKIYDHEPNIIVLLLDSNLNENYHKFLKEKFGEDFYNNCLTFVKQKSTDIYHNLIYLSDLLLDTHPFGGCNTSLEGFTYKKIIITKPSEYLAGRFTYGFYKKIGITEPIAYTDEDYCDKVLYYLHNKEARKKLEKKIFTRSSSLFADRESVVEWTNKLVELAKPHIELIEPSYKKDVTYSVNTLDLLKPYRFDIIFKYIYAKYRSRWALEYYQNHIKVLNGGYAMITNYQDIEKNSTSEFTQKFIELIEDIKENGTKNCIPVYVKDDKDFYISNGSHRVGVNLALQNQKIDISVSKVINKMPVGYPTFAFRNRNGFNMPAHGSEVQIKMPQIQIDYGVLEYIKLKNSHVRIMTVFSKSNLTNLVIDKLGNYNVSILSYSETTLTDVGFATPIE